MGWNTTVVILNDGLDAIERDPGFGKNLARAIKGLSLRGPQDVPALNHCNPCRVIETHHADGMVAVLVGGNTGQTLGYAGGYTIDVDDPNSVRVALENLCSQHGYRIVKKPARRGRQSSEHTAAPAMAASDGVVTEK